MKRYLSVWLPRWPIERRSGFLALKQGNPLPPDGRKPLVLSTMSKSGAQITATNDAAEAQNLVTGMTIANARAVHPLLIVKAADAEGDIKTLNQLALWCQRYSPLTRIEAPDGVCIDITGCAHLFGGEVSMAHDIADRLHGFGLTARIAITPTIGAGWALTRYGTDKITIISTKDIGSILAPLPGAGLRLDEVTVSALAKVGLNQIGMLIGKPRIPLTSRFGRSVIYRLDQAFGNENETFNPLDPPPFYRAECRFSEPIITLAAVEDAVRHLVKDLTESLFCAGKATRRLELSLYRVDGWQERLGFRISELSRDAGHLSRLLCERLGTIKDNAGFGFEAATLGAFDVEELEATQSVLPDTCPLQGGKDDIAQLLDRLVNRFGSKNVTRFVPGSSYMPERASRSASVFDMHQDHDWIHHSVVLQGKTAFARPLLIFTKPEEITAVFETPDKPPASFNWRNIAHRVARADGPERIAPEWWEGGNSNRRTRDYYRVEDNAGRRFWLYRDGLFERAGDEPKWFIHGVFS